MKKYQKEAQNLKLTTKPAEEIVIHTQSSSNIALIKYWGKRPIQLPQNPSISFTLTTSRTEMEIKYSYTENRKQDFVKLYFEEKLNLAFGRKIQKFIESIEHLLPFLGNFNLEIRSGNTFPHSSGIASSASSMSALALNFCQLEQKLFNTLPSKNNFLTKSSYIARLASGSASRSVYPGYTIWGESEFVESSNDEYAVPLLTDIQPKFRAMQDRILITASKEKSVSSSQGHQLMERHPYRDVRYAQAKKNIGLLIKAMESGDWESFSSVVEEEAMSLHALMMNSKNPYTLMNQNTWNIIHTIRKIREERNLEIAYTLDAGPNVHLLFPKSIEKEMDILIKEYLLPFCLDNRVINDYLKMS